MRRITRTMATMGCFLAAQLCMAAIPAAPSMLMATADSQTEITLSWTDNSGDESGFKIERSPDGIGSWSQVDTVGANVGTWTDDGLSANTLWYYRVRAWNGDGDSNNSTTANAHTTYATEYGGTPVWKALLLVYGDTDVHYVEGGVTNHYTGSMNTTKRDLGVWAFHQFASLASELSEREALMVPDVVYVPHALTNVSPYGESSYMVSPGDIAADLAAYAPTGTYDTVCVYWHPGDVPTSYLALGGTRTPDGATYTSFLEWDRWDEEVPGEGWIHEWLHGLEHHFGDFGHRFPTRGPDGAEEHGYTQSPTRGWTGYYGDMMTDRVWETNPPPSDYVGVPVTGWRQGTRQNTRASVQGDWFYTNSLSRYQITGTAAWNSNQNDFDVTLGTATAADNKMYTPLLITNSFALRGSVSVPSSGAGSSDSVALAFRGGSDEWWATVEYGTGLTEQLSLFKNEVRQATFPLAIGAGWYTIKLDVDYAADTVRMKAWPRNENEPADWQLSVALGSDWTADEIGFRHYGQGTRVDDLVAMTEIVGGAFTEVTGTGLPGVSNGSAVWGDYDNDGDLDLLLVGNGNSGDIGAVYRNNGDGTFTDINVGLPAVHEGTALWGDLDNDGDLDLFIAGIEGSTRIARTYRNNGDDTFTLLETLGGFNNGSAAFGDFDNDGDLDLVCQGWSDSGRTTRLYRNNGAGSFSYVSGTGLIDVERGALAWADYDRDGDLDLLLTGNSSVGDEAKVYRNNGDSTFTDIGAGLQGVCYRAAAAWGDYNGDGWPDIFLSGYSGGERYAIIYHNNGDGTFSDIHAGLGGIADAGASWGDLDNDGDLDLAYAGQGGGGFSAAIWYNEGGDTFSYYPNGLTDVRDASVAWGDYDGDGRLDLLLAGKDASDAHVIELWRNATAAETANTAPAAPSGLGAAVDGRNVLLSWSAAADNETPTNGLTYNLRIGTAPGSENIMSAMASTASGYRRIAALGNVGSGTNWSIRGLAEDDTYYWSIQAVDAAFAGGVWANESTFSIAGVPAITTHAVSNITTSTAQCGGEAPDTGGAPILAKGLVWHTAANPTVTSHTGITDHGGGSGSFDDTLGGLTPGQTYHVRAYASNSVYTAYGEERSFTAFMPGAGNALEFDGTDDTVSIDDDDDLDLTTQYTIECWFRADSVAGEQGLVSKYQEYAANGFSLYLFGSDLVFDNLNTSGLGLESGKWYHVAAVNNNGTRSLYVNGSPVALSGFNPVTVQANNNPIRLGSHYSGKYLDGRLDDVRLWSTARPQEDVRDNMHRAVDPASAGLVANYRFDHLEGSALWDVTGNGHDGTLVNGPSWQTSTFPCAAEISGNLNLRGAWNARTESLPSSLLSVEDSDVTPGQYIVTGHDGGALTANTVDRPATTMWRLNRVWRMETAESPAGDVHMDCSGIASLITQNEALRLLVDADGTFLNADILPGSFADDTFTVNGHAFQSGSYYTLAEVDTSGIETWYVDAGRPDDNGDSSTWGTAKRSIQAAVDLAGEGDTVLITNGLYNVGGALVPGGTLSNRVAITKNILVRSVNGPGATVIAGILEGGSNGTDAVRCVYLTGGGTLSGFTLYRGYTHESGADDHKCGGGVYVDDGTVTNCVVNHCSAHYGGGLAIAYAGGLAVDCEIRLNTSSGWAGGALLLGTNGVIDRCVIQENEAGTRGGGLYLYHGGLVRNSLVSDNWGAGDGGGIFFDSGGAARNCTLTKNFTTDDGNGGGIAFFDVQGKVVNSIVSDNFVSGTGLNYHNVPAGGVTYTCTTPALDGDGNINEPPDFMSSTDYHLHPISQCIDSGTNRTDLARDLDGIPRPLDGDANGTTIVDMGCYEFVSSTADSDGDGVTDGDETVADTDPADSGDWFRITAVSNRTVFFQSSENRLYSLLWTTSLVDGVWFTNETRMGIGGADSMQSTNSLPQEFYRVKVSLP